MFRWVIFMITFLCVCVCVCVCVHVFARTAWFCDNMVI